MEPMLDDGREPLFASARSFLARIGVLRPVRRQTASTPPGRVVFAFGDVHGRADLLARALDAALRSLSDRPTGGAEFVFLGDYVDRGPNSADVLEQLIDFKRRYGELYRSVFLLGNHEIALMNFLRDPARHRGWIRHGGFETLRSYGVYPSLEELQGDMIDVAAQFERQMGRHVDFLRMETRTSHVSGQYFFSHAGYHPDKDLTDQTVEDLTMGHPKFLKRGGARVGLRAVHGHYMSEEPEFTRHRIGIDTGAYAHSTLTVLRLEGAHVSYFTTQEQHRLAGPAEEDVVGAGDDHASGLRAAFG